MKIQGIISATVLMLSAVLSAPAFACSSTPDNGGINESGILLAEPNQNRNLGCGAFEFAGLHSDHDSHFLDRWKFTVAEDTTASITVFDIELGFDLPRTDGAKIFDTKNLAFTVFDDDAGKFLGWANENETLGGIHLVAGRDYTLKVFGDVGGTFGSTYHGTLETCVAPVPLSDTAPMLGSALALLAFSYRKRLIKNA